MFGDLTPDICELLTLKHKHFDILLNDMGREVSHLCLRATAHMLKRDPLTLEAV